MSALFQRQKQSNVAAGDCTGQAATAMAAPGQPKSSEALHWQPENCAHSKLACEGRSEACHVLLYHLCTGASVTHAGSALAVGQLESF